jgi:sorbitol-specific phosphotransferase system component IIC
MEHGNLMNATLTGIIVAIITLIIALAARIEIRERRLTRLTQDVAYLRRDLDQILRLYKLVPAAEQEKRRR